MTERYINIAKSIENSKVLIIGDIMLDKYLEGHVSRISPEAPVQVVKVKNERFVLGGAANVASNIARLGGHAILIGAVGNDSASGVMKDILEEKGIKPLLISIKGRPTIVKERVMSGGQQLIRMDYEQNMKLDDDSKTELKKMIDDHKDDFDCIAVSDYAKGFLDIELMDHLRSLDKPIIVDPKPKHAHLYHDITLMTPNMKETKELTGIDGKSDEDVEKMGKMIKEKFNCNVLVKRSGDGMTLFEDDTIKHIPTQAKEVYDVTGAGDTVTSVIAMSIAAGFQTDHAAIVANHAAGIVVGKVGTSTVSKQELVEVIKEERSKVVDWDTIERISKDEKKKGRKIVFTNGCFDILHSGHVHLLRETKKLGNTLVLGLNSDDSIKRLKGESRPIVAEDERAEILAALEFVDYVVFFGEDTPKELIAKVRPDVLVKGGDYEIKDIVGHEQVLSDGGVVTTVNLKDGKSTTNIVERIKNEHTK